MFSSLYSQTPKTLPIMLKNVHKPFVLCKAIWGLFSSMNMPQEKLPTP